MSSSSGAKPSASSSSAKFREHSHGRQDRDYTPEQKSAVERIRRCKATAYYEILAVEKSSSDGQIKKAYHKLSLATHPDKNGAPGADEAFKLVSKAFQVLSDPQKRQIFDQTGSDPESRGGGGGGGGGGSPFAGFGSASHHAGGPEMSPEDFINLFFSNGGMGGGIFGNGGGIFDDGRGFGFGGGPGIRVHQFGTGPGMRRRRTGNQRANNEQPEEGADEPTNLTRIFWQLLPLILFFLLPILSGLFSGDGEQKLRGPQFAMDSQPPYTHMRITPEHKIPFYVNPKDLEGLAMRDITNLGKRAEAAIVNAYSAGCSREELVKQQMLQDAQGFFFTDQDMLKRAKEMQMPNCRKLQELGVPRRRY
ncbi:DnaJ-domain-containing protein [Wilcoxina mikolae CBS 423.85]|nr:DnaJ-domain-containing protein [Wilcoxina mikolae CBS 423.85]